MNAKYVLVRDGVEEDGEIVADHEALYIDGERVHQGETEDRSGMLELFRIHGIVEDELPTTNLGPKDVDKLINSMEFPINLSDFTDTEIPPAAAACGTCGSNCGQCGSPDEAKPAEEDPDTASPPRPQQKIAFVPNDPDTFFTYEEGEYQLALERLRRYAEDWPDKRTALAEAVEKVSPEKQGSLGTLISETSSVVQAILMQQWAHEIMKKTEEDGKADDVAVDENGHKVNEQECPFLFWNLQFMRHSLAKTLIDSTRQGANAADLTGVVNNEALSAMTVFIDDFVHICPSLRKVDLGNKDPLRNTL